MKSRPGTPILFIRRALYCTVCERSVIVDCDPAEAITVIIECTNCRARYQYDEDRFERKPSKKIKCAKCASVFEIHNPAFAAPKPAEPPAADMTFSKSSTVLPKPE